MKRSICGTKRPFPKPGSSDLDPPGDHHVGDLLGRSGMPQEGATLINLDREECLALLRSQPVGRVALPVPDDGPLVVPVNYVVDGDVIVFRSDPGTKVTLLRAGPVSFQVDSVDWYHRSGWSVLGRGRAYEATHWEVDHLLLEPWTDGDKRVWIRLELVELTGRRLDHIELSFPPDNRGYL